MFIGGRDGGGRGIGEVLVVEMVMAWYYWGLLNTGGGGNCDSCCKS